MLGQPPALSQSQLQQRTTQLLWSHLMKEVQLGTWAATRGRPVVQQLPLQSILQTSASLSPTPNDYQQIVSNLNPGSQLRNDIMASAHLPVPPFLLDNRQMTLPQLQAENELLTKQRENVEREIQEHLKALEARKVPADIEGQPSDNAENLLKMNVEKAETVHTLRKLPSLKLAKEDQEDTFESPPTTSPRQLVPPSINPGDGQTAYQSIREKRKRQSSPKLAEWQEAKRTKGEFHPAAPFQPTRSLGKAATTLLKNWMFAPEHVNNPYPTELEKQLLAEAAGITKKQVCNWFVNARKRLWQPMRKSHLQSRQREAHQAAVQAHAQMQLADVAQRSRMPQKVQCAMAAATLLPQPVAQRSSEQTQINAAASLLALNFK